MAQILNLPLEPARLQLSAVQGEISKPLKHITHLHISPLGDRQKRVSCKPAVTQLVTSDLPTAPIYQVGDLPHIMGLQLADPDYYNPGRIDILLGADMAPKIMSKALLRNGAEAEPIAQATLFGWVLSGPVIRKNSSNSPIATNHNIQAPPPDEEPLAESIFRLWVSDEPEKEQPPISVLEQQVEKHFTDTVMYLPAESRYQITLPKTSATEELGDSRPQALSRYLSNERSIQRRGIWEPFQQVIKGYFDLNHAELVPAEEQLPHPNFYLPMHAVLKDSSTSTKLRVVFDGSATTTSGLSLNQSLLVGPTLQPTLSTTLLKFRCYPIALNADISKMYREVKLSSADKDLHRFLWRASPNLPVQDCRMTRVTFGVSASPYLAVRALLQTADDHGEEYPRATQHIKHSFYVDDFLGGADTPQEALLLFTQMRRILERGGFNLCKWRSSSSEVLQQIPVSLQEESHIKDATSPNTPTQSKALGLQWDSRQDNMSPSIIVCDSYRSTKRGLISDVSKTYDILGWISPAVLSMKLLFQQLWKTGHDWDEPVPPELLSLHSRWRSELPALAKKQLPRCYTLSNYQVKSKTLHGFSDASKLAYGAVVYCRSTYHDHPPVISLVTAKTKVATLKPTTIPRLELCGAVLLTRLLKHTASILQIPAEDWHAWSDSAIVLAWLDGNTRKLPVYVSNRVSIVMQETSPRIWHHVPTTSNPADCASRGIMPLELLSHPLWWEGPPWLKDDPYQMPKQPPRKPLSELLPVHVIQQQQTSILDHILTLNSNYHSTLSLTAWFLRFYYRLKNGRPSPDNRTRHLSGAEVTSAEHWLLKEAQRISFPQDKQALEKNKPLPKSSKIKSLNPWLDQEGLLRVGGRLSNSSLSKSQQHPILADAGHPLMIKLFQHMHLVLSHCGPTLLLCATGSRLHVVGARRLSRAVCAKCVTCRKYAPRMQHQLMGELPASRVNPVAPFTHTGMDFAGPFTIKMGYTRRPVPLEAHICCFICMTYKAVHLEVVSDQTTPAFKAALQRFISRRNCPSHLYSDNGGNFIGARNQLRKLYSFLSQQEDEEMKHYLATHHKITWHNSPPVSPHFGGLWESAIKSMKKHLKRVLGTTLFSFEELTTIVCQVEACLNSRPLLPLTSHSQDGLATLTSSHFLLFRAPTSYPEDPRLPDKPHLLTKWNQCQAMVHHFWRRWSREYLNSLQARTKWQKKQPNLQTEDIVILKPKDHFFNCHWPLARVISTHPGKDGLVRVVTIKTASGTYKRAVTRLSLLFRPEQQSLQEASTNPLPPVMCPVKIASSSGQPKAAAAAHPPNT